MRALRVIIGLALVVAIVESFSLKATASKKALLRELDDSEGFNRATKDRTDLVAALTLENPTTFPGSTKAFTPLAVGKWRIVYAPHIYTMARFTGGSFDPVDYILKPDGSMTSHAQYNFPIIGSGWLSVSGNYGSEDEDRVCRVDFDKAWIRTTNEGPGMDPYNSLESVPPSIWKDCIQALGKFFFIDSVSKFPVSYLDTDTIVFDFELLGTRICARKIGPAE
jgi:hypothetical protein